MKARLGSFTLLSLLWLSLTSLPGEAQQTLFEDGPINGTVEAWTINFGFAVDDTITISSSTGNATVGGLSFGAWLLPGDTVTSVEVSITSEILGGTTYFDGQVNLTGSNCSVNGYGYDVCTETGSFNGPTLNNGNYWLNLQNAQVPNGDPVYWDENSGAGCHSPGCPSNAADGGEGTIPSEAFTILGASQTSTGSSPEPSSLVLLGTGLLGAAGFLRKKVG